MCPSINSAQTWHGKWVGDFFCKSSDCVTVWGERNIQDNWAERLELPKLDIASGITSGKHQYGHWRVFLKSEEKNSTLSLNILTLNFWKSLQMLDYLCTSLTLISKSDTHYRREGRRLQTPLLNHYSAVYFLRHLWHGRTTTGISDKLQSRLPALPLWASNAAATAWWKHWLLCVIIFYRNKSLLWSQELPL